MTTSTTKKPAARKPQDHQSKADRVFDEEHPPAGAELMRPVSDLRSQEIAEASAEIADLFAEVGIDLFDEDRKEVEIDSTPATLRVFGTLGSLLEKYSKDAEAFAKFDRGPGSSTRAADLAMWFLAELGKSDGSAS